MFGLGIQEILVIAFIILLLFGGKKIPEMMQGLGRGVKSFKDGMNGNTREDDHESHADDAPAGRHSGSGSIKSVDEVNVNDNKNDVK